jgi:hypothetical protein
MDPAAFGTAIIGLDSVRLEDELYERAVPRPAAPPRLASVRRRVASALTGAAAIVDPSVTARQTSRTAARL